VHATAAASVVGMAACQAAHCCRILIYRVIRYTLRLLFIILPVYYIGMRFVNAG
jgi:hypothetical protein